MRTWGINVEPEPDTPFVFTARAGHGYRPGDVITQGGPAPSLWRRVLNRIRCEPDHPTFVVRTITPTQIVCDEWRAPEGELSWRWAVRMIVLIGVVMILVLALAANAATTRSRDQRAAFQRSHPCPATGKPHGACPGYVVDHVVPLCKGGADAPNNMQWQDKPSAKAKDRWECK